MSLVDAIGWIAALSSASLAVPQGVRIASTRSVAGISTLAWQTMLIAGLAWTAHGLLTGTAQIIWPNVLLAITSAWVLWQLTAARSLPVLRTWSLPVVYAGLAFAADVWWGPIAYAVMAFIPGAIGQSSQLREIVRVPDPAGVSMVALVAGLTNQVLWLSYAIPAGERAVMSVAVPMGVLFAATIVALAARRRRVAAGSVPRRRRITHVIPASAGRGAPAVGAPVATDPAGTGPGAADPDAGRSRGNADAPAPR